MIFSPIHYIYWQWQRVPRGMPQLLLHIRHNIQVGGVLIAIPKPHITVPYDNTILLTLSVPL